MKKIYNKISEVKNVSSEKFPQALSLLMVIFFLVFGATSLFVFLLHTPA